MDITNSAHWMWNYNIFVQELQSTFGPRNPVGDAEAALVNLTMADGDTIMQYNDDFVRYATQVEWDESSLASAYLHGLPSRLRRELLQSGRRATYKELMFLATDLDGTYWVIKNWAKDYEEPSDSNPSSPVPSAPSSVPESPSGSPVPSEYQPGSSSPSLFTESPAQSVSSSVHPSSSGHLSYVSSPSVSSSQSQESPPSGSASDLANSDHSSPPPSQFNRFGRLTVQERERRISNHLCLYCGADDHYRADCPRRQAASVRTPALTNSDDEDDN
jgi:hypothetical protein